MGWFIFFCLLFMILVYFAEKGRERNDRCILFISFLFCLFFSCASITVFDLRLELQISVTVWFIVWSYVNLLSVLDSSHRRYRRMTEVKWFDDYWAWLKRLVRRVWKRLVSVKKIKKTVDGHYYVPA